MHSELCFVYIQTKANAVLPEAQANHRSPSCRNNRERTRFTGVRRVWKTMKNTSSPAVTTCLKKLTTQGNHITVKRRTFTDSENGKQQRWFILRGSESVLSDLEKEETE